MKMRVKKTIDVDIQLDEREKNLLIDSFDLLECIADKVAEEGLLEDKDEFTISWYDDSYRYVSHKINVEDLSEFRARFDEFI